MRKTKYIVKPTSQFKKDYKPALRRHLDVKRLEDVVVKLAMGESLRRNTEITNSQAIGQATGNATSCQIGS